MSGSVPPATLKGSSAQDYQRASWLVLFTAFLFVGLALALMLL